MTNIAYLTGNLLYTCFSINQEVFTTSKNLQWTETYGLTPDPVNASIWVPLESFYEFWLNANFSNQGGYLLEATEATENFLLQYSAMISYLAVNDTRNTIFSISDMCVFLYNMTEGWTNTY